MRYLTKTIRVVNDGFCNRKKSASDRLQDSVNRYVAKMQKRGWIPYCALSGGNAFYHYEGIVRLCKPTNETDRSKMSERAIDHCWSVSEKGVFFWR